MNSVLVRKTGFIRSIVLWLVTLAIAAGAAMAQTPEQLSASHILIMHVESDRVPAEITRSKEEALELAKQVAAKAQAKDADFAALARSMGVQGVRVEKPWEVGNAVKQMMSHPGPFLIDVVIESDTHPERVGRTCGQ